MSYIVKIDKEFEFSLENVKFIFNFNQILMINNLKNNFLKAF